VSSAGKAPTANLSLDGKRTLRCISRVSSRSSCSTCEIALLTLLHTYQGIVLNVERAQLQALLPEGYEVAEDVQPTILFEVMNLRKLPWLAGRGEQHE
jgi:hypothetical protein